MGLHAMQPRNGNSPGYRIWARPEADNEIRELLPSS